MRQDVKSKIQGAILRLGNIQQQLQKMGLTQAAELDAELDGLRAALAVVEESMKPEAQICWVEGIQEHGACTLTTGYCGFLSYADGERWRKALIEKNPSLNYIKLFPVYVKKIEESK